MHRHLNLTMCLLEVRVCLVARLTVVQMDLPGDNEVMIVTMRMAMANIVVRH